MTSRSGGRPSLALVTTPQAERGRRPLQGVKQDAARRRGLPDRHAHFGGHIQHFLKLLDMSAMADQDHLELSLPRPERGQHGLPAFEMLHKAGDCKWSVVSGQ